MEIDWFKGLDDVFKDQVACPRCGVLTPELLAGYSRQPWAAYVAPRCQNCTDKEDCESRKLVFLCDACARELRLRARPVDQEGMMTLLLRECQEDLEDSLDYLADFWLEDLDVDPDISDPRLETLEPEVYEQESASRVELEQEYLTYHDWFRQHQVRIPQPDWRARYVENIIGLGYTTLLGD